MLATTSEFDTEEFFNFKNNFSYSSQSSKVCIPS